MPHSRWYPVYWPKAFSLIGDLVDTLRDRSIVIPLKRATPPNQIANCEMDLHSRSMCKLRDNAGHPRRFKFPVASDRWGEPENEAALRSGGQGRRGRADLWHMNHPCECERMIRQQATIAAQLEAVRTTRLNAEWCIPQRFKLLP